MNEKKESSTRIDLTGSWRDDWPTFIKMTDEQQKLRERAIRADEAHLWNRRREKEIRAKFAPIKSGVFKNPVTVVSLIKQILP